jgi:hypothetical protein
MSLKRWMLAIRNKLIKSSMSARPGEKGNEENTQQSNSKKCKRQLKRQRA